MPPKTSAVLIVMLFLALVAGMWFGESEQVLSDSVILQILIFVAIFTAIASALKEVHP